MSNVTIVGTQWGDEGKGKIVDWLSAEADIIVRFQGGHNAGHTIMVGDTVYKLHLLPSGVVRQGKLSVIGNGVVVDPWALLGEMATLKAQGIDITPENLLISEQAPVILPLHSSIDRALEETRGNNKIGTTGRGIGPAYEDKVGRRALRMCDLAHPDTLRDKLEDIAFYHNSMHKGLDTPPVVVGTFINDLLRLSERLAPFIGPAWQVLHRAQAAGKRILFEGAQGVMLDVDHGTYPYVTSSNTAAAQAAIGAGVAPAMLGYVLGITKAYATRVGSGPFPTELNDDIAAIISSVGQERGTTTGRPRRCGWFDAVMARQAMQISGVTGMALMKLDVLDSLPEIKICTGYVCGDAQYDYLPAARDLQAVITPVYETMPGWQTPLKGARSLNDLPENARRYIARLEELVGVPAVIVSTGPERDDTILVKDILA